MWAKLRGKRKTHYEEKMQTEKNEIKMKKVLNKIEHHYFKGHVCSITPGKQTKYVIEDNRTMFWKIILYFTAVRSGDIRARYMYRSYAALSAEVHRQYMLFPCSIHPFSRLRLAIEIISIFSLQFCTVVLSTYMMISGTNKLNDAFITTCETLFVIDIVSNFFTGYIEGRSSRFVVLDVKKIAWRYIRTWLLVDLTFCSGLVVYHFRTQQVRWDVATLTLKILRLPTIFQYTNNVLEVVGASHTTKTAAEIILIIANYLLWNCYFQFAIEYILEDSTTPLDPRKCSWLTITGMWNASSLDRAVYAYNRAVGMLQQSTKVSLREQGACYEQFFIVAWRIGKVLVIHCGLKYMLLLFGLESSKSRYYMMTQEVQFYMDQHRFPARIKKKLLKYYAVRFHSHFFAEQLMMESVSGRLREDIIMLSGRQLVGEVEFLKHLPRTLLLQIGVKLKVVIFLAGDIIYKINTIGDCLYFIDKGTVAIYSESGQEICHLQDGDFFGEIALVIQPRFRTASAVAVTNCDLFRLDKKDFDSTIAIYPTVYEDIKKVAYQRMERTIVVDEHHKAELRNGKDQVEENM